MIKTVSARWRANKVKQDLFDFIYIAKISKDGENLTFLGTLCYRIWFDKLGLLSQIKKTLCSLKRTFKLTDPTYITRRRLARRSLLGVY